MCYITYLYLVVFYSFVIRATIKLGRIPTPDNPDPKVLGYTVHREFVNTSLAITIYGIALLILLVVIAILGKQIKNQSVHIPG